MAEAKAKTEVTKVKMSDGREVGFAGKKKVLKDTVIDESKIVVDGDTITLSAGAIKVRMDFINGETRLYDTPITLIPQFCGHGGEQKRGDELAYTPKAGEMPPTVEDYILWSDELDERIQAGNWNAVREAGEGGVAGASIVVRALMEASGKTQDEVKQFLQKKLDAAKERNQKLSRKELYDSFRNPETAVGKIIDRMQKEQLSKASKVDADAELEELKAAA